MSDEGSRSETTTGDNSRWVSVLKRLRALPEKRMRREVLSENLATEVPAAVLQFIHFVLTGAEKRHPDSLTAMEALNDWILVAQQQGPTYELLAEVYRMAREQDLDGVTHLLMIASPQRGPVPATQAPGDLDLSRLPLGERKSLARGRDRARLERLLLDPEPSVVHKLLRNARLVERNVLSLASRRPVRAEVLREIFQSRWGQRYAIRLALVCNPYTPSDISLKLAGFLLLRDLRQVAADGSLHPLVRAEAKRMAGKRRAPSTEADN